MKFSINSALHTANFYQSYLWSVKFEEETPNFQDSGGSVGLVVPAQSVTEMFYTGQYEDITVGNGLIVPFPKVASFIGQISITFYDDGRKDSLLRISNFLKEWVADGGKFQVNNQFKNWKDSSKVIEIYKYSKDSGSYVKKSRYSVYPPEALQYVGGADQSAVVSDATFRVIKPEFINDD